MPADALDGPSSTRAVTRGIPYALAAAGLFGASTPLAKLLVGQMPPVLLAGLLYLGSGIGLAVLWAMRSRVLGRAHETPLRAADGPWLAGAILTGGVLGPVLLMVGLSLTPGTTSSLLLNTEGVFTAALAWVVFGENYDRRVLLGMAAIVLGGVVLSWGGNLQVGGWLGPLAIAGACLAWGVDNNLTRKVSGGDPVQVACLKGGVAGAVNLLIALVLGARLPAPLTIVQAGAVGFLGYGLSLACFVLALRHLGTARTGAYFSTAPFIGAVLSLLVLRDPLTLPLAIAALLMGLGVWLHLTERHLHDHQHAELVHGHRHDHDDHHVHEHRPDMADEGPHAHEHRHDPLHHAHPHYPDLHHGHAH
jgi:drug/metabolite transporter (DMT)-like permease